MSILDSHIGDALKFHCTELEKKLDTNLINIYGPIDPAWLYQFRDFLDQQIKNEVETSNKKDSVTIVLTTDGGSAEMVERMVEMIRHHWERVQFLVPSHAFSAGTIFSMSGDKILMDYTSSLGPIDPQVKNKQGNWVPALGYLDKINEMISKSADNTITPAEYSFLQQVDLAELSHFEQARELTVTLLKRWLVEFKFKNWSVHRTNVTKKGSKVTDQEKQDRAEEIARLLGDNQTWHSHGRMIGIKTLKNELKLEIDDYSDNSDLRSSIRKYSDLMMDYALRHNIVLFLHNKYRIL